MRLVGILARKDMYIVVQGDVHTPFGPVMVYVIYNHKILCIEFIYLFSQINTITAQLVISAQVPLALLPKANG
jgi:hypothetical protein